jgi:hypothetical protein
VLDDPLSSPLPDARTPTRRRVGVRRTGVLGPAPPSEEPGPFDVVRDGSGVLSGAVSLTGLLSEFAAVSGESVEVRRVGVRRRGVDRDPAVRVEDREVVVLRRVVRRPLSVPLSGMVDSTATSGSGAVTATADLREAGALRLLGPLRGVRVRREEAAVGSSAVVLRLLSDQRPVKKVLFNFITASATLPASLDRLLSKAATSMCLPWFFAVWMAGKKSPSPLTTIAVS